MYLAALLFLPARVVLLLAGLFSGFTCYWLVARMPYGRFRQLFLKIGGYISGRLLFHSQGYHWVSQESKHAADFIPTYPRDAAESDSAIVVGNHVNMLDVFYMSYRYQSGFVAKKEEKSVYAFRTAGDAYGAIWVDRSSESQKHDVIQQIQDRVKEYVGADG